MQELGRGYQRYHADLERQLTALGAAPVPSEYLARYGVEDGFARVGRENAHRQQIWRTELVLRRAWQAHRAGIDFEEVTVDMMREELQAPLQTVNGDLNQRDRHREKRPVPGTSAPMSPELAAVWPKP